jgi:hypothetical protein
MLDLKCAPEFRRRRKPCPGAARSGTGASGEGRRARDLSPAWRRQGRAQQGLGRGGRGQARRRDVSDILAGLAGPPDEIKDWTPTGRRGPAVRTSSRPCPTSASLDPGRPDVRDNRVERVWDGPGPSISRFGTIWTWPGAGRPGHGTRGQDVRGEVLRAARGYGQARCALVALNRLHTREHATWRSPRRTWSPARKLFGTARSPSSPRTV